MAWIKNEGWVTADLKQCSRQPEESACLYFLFLILGNTAEQRKATVRLPIPKKERKRRLFLCGREDLRIQMCSLLTGAYSFPSLPPPPSSVFSDTHKHRHTPRSPRAGQGSEARLFQVGSVFLRLGSKMRGSADGLSTVWLQRACLFKSCLRSHTLGLQARKKQQQ